MSKTNPARGMRDFLPDQIRKRNYVIRVIKDVYEKYGFEPLETPTIENLSTLTNKYGEEGDQLMYKILKRGEKLKKQLRRDDDLEENDLADLALRYDLTVPFARVVAHYKHELPRFFKRYQIQPVWRADRPARGRYREFYQCDVDAIGSKSMIVEAELCLAVDEIFEKLGFEDFEIRINHRAILFGWLEKCDINAEMQNSVLVAIDKLDKIGRNGVDKEFERLGLSGGQIASLMKIFDMEDDSENGQTLSNLMESLTDNKDAVQAIEDLKELSTYSGSIALRFDPTLARGLSYYTGSIFEVGLTNDDYSGSLAGGGRYDGLIGMFGKEEIPAVGISPGLERIILIMEERDMFPDDLVTNSAEVLITVWNKETAGESLRLASEIRAMGFRVLVYPQPDKLGKQFKYADRINAHFVCVLGENEIIENRVTLKNMKTGDQQTIGREEIEAALSSTSRKE
jgi:histidyl-tRNA synthetase